VNASQLFLTHPSNPRIHLTYFYNTFSLPTMNAYYSLAESVYTKNKKRKKASTVVSKKS